MTNAPDYENNLAFAPKEEKQPTYFVPLADYNEVKNMFLKANKEISKLKDLLEKAMDDVYQMSLVNEDSRELLMQIQEVLK